MKKIHILSYFFIIGIMCLASCNKEDAQMIVTKGSFPANALSSSASTVILTQVTENDPAITFTWDTADFGEQPVITYTLQLDVPSDTAGGEWANAKVFLPGNNMLTYTFLGKDLNNTINAMSLAAGSPNQLVFRIKAEVPQYNGSTSSLAPVYTNTLSVTATGYGSDLFVPGDYQGWDPATAPVISPVEDLPGLYEGYVNMPDNVLQYFKYTSARDWDHINYGDGGNGTFSTDGAAAGLSVPEGGYYELTADLNTNVWTATKTTWGVIGDATPGGWSTDTEMAYDETNQVWTVTLVMVQAGSFKFRANNDWKIDFGIDADGNIQYADNPFFAYNPNLNNLTVPEDGNYTITLDLHVSQHYTFSLQKN